MTENSINAFNVPFPVGSYVRIISAGEYTSRLAEHKALSKNDVSVSKANHELLEMYGNKVYKVVGYKYDGKVLLEENPCAWPVMYLDLWKKDSGDIDGDVEVKDFVNILMTEIAGEEK